jgi:hypothetical protein
VTANENLVRLNAEETLKELIKLIEKEIQSKGIMPANHLLDCFDESMEWFNAQHSTWQPVSSVQFLEVYLKIAISTMNDFCGKVEAEIQSRKDYENPQPLFVIKAFGFDQSCRKVTEEPQVIGVFSHDQLFGDLHRKMVVTPAPETAETSRVLSDEDDPHSQCRC